MTPSPLARRPKNIILDIDNRLMQIDWQDGRSCVYDFTQLRRACPCAACQPWKEGPGAFGEISESARRAVGELRRMEDVSQVGGYAINFRWTDGHDSGIYSFEYLRSLCPDDEDSANTGEAHAQ